MCNSICLWFYNNEIEAFCTYFFKKILAILKTLKSTFYDPNQIGRINCVRLNISHFDIVQNL